MYGLILLRQNFGEMIYFQEQNLFTNAEMMSYFHGNVDKNLLYLILTDSF